MRYLTLEETLYLHHEAIRCFGGHPGIADLGLIQSAVNRPQATFGGKELYPTIHDKAAALVESLVQNHGFVDGNKRVGAYALGLFLELNGYRLRTRGLILSDFILAIARRTIARRGMAQWIRHHSRKTSP